MTATVANETPSAFLVLKVEPVPPLPRPGDSSGTVRVTVVNRGPSDVYGVDVGFCQDVIQLPFAVSGDIPGGCAAPQTGQYCFDYFGPDFGLGPIPANQSQSCLLKLTAPQPITQPLYFPFAIEGIYADANGTWVANANPSGEIPALVLALGPPTDAVPGLSLIGLPALMLVLAAIGMSLIRARRIPSLPARS